MAASGDILKEFFVSLAYQVDGSSEKRVEESIDKTAGKLMQLAKRAAQAAAAVVAAIALIAKSLEDLYYASRRTGAAAENIRAFGYAVSQLGGSSAGALSSLEGFARFLRSSPGAFQFIQNLGVQTRDAAGNMRDTAEVLLDVGTKLREMPRYRANIYADTLGIDELTLNAMIDGTEKFSAEYHDMVARMGIDAKQAAQGGRDFTQVMRQLFMSTDLLRMKYNQMLAGPLGEQIRKVTRIIVDNADIIVKVLGNASRLVLGLASLIINAMVRASEGLRRLYEWFTSLPIQTQRWTAAILGLGVAWRALNGIFSASPLGRLLILMTAFLLLLEDYDTYKNGGESAIDWGAWEPQIEGVKEAIASLGREFGALGRMLNDQFGEGFTEWLENTGRVLMNNIFPAFRQFAGIISDLLDLDAMISNWNLAGAGPATRNLMRRFGLNSTPREEVPGRPGSGEPTNAPSRGANGPAGPGPSAGQPAVTTLLNLIAGAEGTADRDNYNETLGYGAYTGGRRNLTGMTLDEIRDLQRDMLRHPGNHLRSSALGRYQITQTTMADLRNQLGLKGDEKFDEAMQDRLATKLLEIEGMERYRRGEISEAEFMEGIARRWASVPRPSTGQGFHDGQRTPRVGLPAVRGAVQGLRAPPPSLAAEGPLLPGQAAPAPSGPVPARGEEPGRNPSIRTGDVNIVVNGTGDPMAVAQRVWDTAARAQGDILRNARGVVR
jgi:muramidase (phage lysozyme)